MSSVKYIFVFLISLILSFSSLANDSTEVLFQKANALYKAKDYASAVQLYDSLIGQSYRSANLYFNTGNAYYKLGQYTKAILYYEKASLLGGTKEDIELNLELAKLHSTDKIDAIPDFFVVRVWKSVLMYYSAKKWAWLSIGFFILGLLLFLLIYLNRSVLMKKVLIPLFVLTGVLFILFTVFSVQKTSIEHHSHYAILFEPTVYVKSAPDIESTDLFLIHEGLKLRLLEEVDDWTKIKLADGKTGWIPSETYWEI
jgi:tetratricopeptide (TPR) repeat protein